jgi:hypothetical protein
VCYHDLVHSVNSQDYNSLDRNSVGWDRPPSAPKLFKVGALRRFQMRVLQSYWRKLAIPHDLTVEMIEPGKYRDHYFSLMWATLPKTISRHFGFGFSKSPKLAVIKSAMELREALEMQRLFASDPTVKHRSGFAMHTDPKSAETSAFNELFERDALLTHWITESPPIAVTRLQDGFLELELQCADPNRSAFAVTKKTHYGCWILGLGCSESQAQAKEHAYRECLASEFRHDWCQSCLTGQHPIALHHRNTASGPVQELWEKLVYSNVKTPPKNSRKPPQINVITNQVTEGAGLYLARAQSDFLLDIDFGSDFADRAKEYFEILKTRYPSWNPENSIHKNGLIPHPLD